MTDFLKKVEAGIKKLSTVLLLVGLFLYTHIGVVRAAVYECPARQSLIWRYGRLVQDIGEEHAVFIFNDKTGDLRIRRTPSHRMAHMQLKILQGLSTNHDLVASSIIHGHLTYSFHLSKWYKPAGIVFLLIENNRVTAGHCTVIQ